MDFHVVTVLHRLLKKFEEYGDIPGNPEVSRKEAMFANRLAGLILEAENGLMDIEEEDVIEIEEDVDWEAPEFDALDSDDASPNQTFRFGDRWVNKEDVEKALSYYRDTSKGHRTAQAMYSRFRWLSTNYHLQKLRDIENEGASYKGDRFRLLAILADRLFEEVKKRLNEGLTLHDRDLRSLTLDLNRKEFNVVGFLASHKWITRWKSSRRIVSRRITKFVTKRCMLNQDQLEKQSKEFVKTSRQEMPQFSPSMILNCDQTGIQKELHGARSLAFGGEKTVVRSVQAKSSLTHSFTFMPVLFADGTMGPKAYMVMSEPTGQFPKSQPIPHTPNLEVRAAKSHIMTKELMCDFLTSCVFIPSVPKKLFLLLDSWPPFKDHAKIRSCLPPGTDVTIRNIPPHCTSMIQPLDVYWNGPWKALLKRFNSHAVAFYPDYVIAQRNNQITMVSVLFHQISSKRFKDFTQYSWNRSGYIDVYTPFQSPLKYLCNGVELQICAVNGCDNNIAIVMTPIAKVRCFRRVPIPPRRFSPTPEEEFLLPTPPPTPPPPPLQQEEHEISSEALIALFVCMALILWFCLFPHVFNNV
ncbi:hypothetical protein GCK72_022529 [Caenorhabditis remanei]|uniref:HTH CENPB-type domain-containing protein n=1 Tax=Caenorhabditis remanei TaxID=31234 RepID=A0A6A5FU17_CAERE|nr:hypothetical protein GCK72_022529 [Caenorhabditis remanei]KAF1746077.1 hypothetical protein GCK72_022529 [Caenorhabditis remanei]